MATLSTEETIPSPSITSAAASGLPNKHDTKPESTTGAPAHTFQDTAQQLTGQALDFLSTASNETLGACLVGLGATTYLVLGRVGLVLIGVVGGVVLHATWEGSSIGPVSQAKAAEEKRRREVGLDVMHRVLDWRSTSGKEDDGEADEEIEKVEIQSKAKLDFADFRPETAGALSDLTDAVIRDYVKWVDTLLWMSCTNRYTDGGITRSFLRKCPFPMPLGRLWLPSSSPCRTTCTANDLRTHS